MQCYIAVSLFAERSDIMAYQPTEWKNRLVERPRTYQLQQNADGTVTLIPSEGVITEEGTPVNAGNMNHIEQGIADAHAVAAAAETPSGAQAKVDALAGAGNTTTVKALKDDLDAHKSDYVRQPGYAATTGSANTYLATLNPVPTAYVDGMGIVAKINVANTGESTINVNGLGAKAIKNPDGTALSSGDLTAGGIYSLKYNATTGNFILVGKGGVILTGTAGDADVAAGKTYYNTDAKTKRTGTATIWTGFTAGTTTTLYSDNAEADSDQYNAAWQKVKDCKINFKGTIRVSFNMMSRFGGGTNTAYAQIYKNGVAVGTLRIFTPTDNTENINYTEDISVNAGDNIQIYAKASANNYTKIMHWTISSGTVFAAKVL